MKRSVAMLLGSLLVLVSVSSCRKELCYNHWEHSPSVKARLNVSYEQEWERDYGNTWMENWDDAFMCNYDDFRPEKPEGLSIMAYQDGKRYSERNVGPDGDLIPLNEGEGAILIINNDTEYILFNDMDNSANATVTTRTRTRSPYSEQYNEVTVNAPDMLYCHYVPKYNGVKKIEPDTLDIVMQPLVYTYYMVFHFDKGAKYIKKCRGALSGMAAAVYLKNGRSSEDKITVLFNEEDCKVYDSSVEASMRSFGIPEFVYGYSEPYPVSAGTCMLTLDVEMTNGAIKTFRTDVSSQLESQPRGGVIIVDGLEISDDEGAAVGGGFEVDVDGWGDYEDVEMPL